MPIRKYPDLKSYTPYLDNKRKKVLGTLEEWFEQQPRNRNFKVPCVIGPYLVGKTTIIRQLIQRRGFRLYELGDHTAPLTVDNIRQFARQCLEDEVSNLRGRHVQNLASILRDVLNENISVDERQQQLKSIETSCTWCYYLGRVLFAGDTEISGLLKQALINAPSRIILLITITQRSPITSDVIWACQTSGKVRWLLKSWYLTSLEQPHRFDRPMPPASPIRLFAFSQDGAKKCTELYRTRSLPSYASKLIKKVGMLPGFVQNLAQDWYQALSQDQTSEFDGWFIDWIEQTHGGDALNNIGRLWWQSLPISVQKLAEPLLRGSRVIRRCSEKDQARLQQYGIIVKMHNKWVVPDLIKELYNRVLGGKKMNVFISYAHQDSTFATRLASDIRQAGLDIFIYEWNLKPGDSIVERINQALCRSDYIIIILSPNSVRSKWVRAEIGAALIRKLASNDISIIPVLYQDCEIPPLLKDYVYLDFRNNSLYQHNFQKLLDAITRTSTITTQIRQGTSSRREPSPPLSPCPRLDNMPIDDLARDLADHLTPAERMRLFVNLTGKLPEELWHGNVEEQYIHLITMLNRHKPSRVQEVIAWVQKNRPDLC